MTTHHSVQGDLTKNQNLVYGALSSATGPLSAYTILDQLRDQGFRAPLQVYRALDKLVEFGMVHRLECLNAFVACRQPNCETHETIVFTICDTCGKVAEVSDDKLCSDLRKLAETTGFHLQKSTVELKGFCKACIAV
ncbi:MAG: Fur family transcriptional regulator [Stappiaceae bacterium]